MPDEQVSCTLITGASSGIGQAIAIRLSGQRRLILHGRDLERLEQTRSRCTRPGEHVVWPYDLNETDGLASSLSELMAEKSTGIDTFVHSAGVLRLLPIRSVDSKTLAEVMNVNFVSVVEIISLLAKKRVNRGNLKNVLLISSIISNFGAPGFSIYSASKGALDSLMRSLAVELAPAVRVNSILPGGIRTTATAELLTDPEVAARFERDYPLGMGDCGDVADAAEFLLSDRSRWITGQQVVIDGGRTVNMSI